MGKEDILLKKESDVVICAYARTPFTKIKKGGLKDTCQEEMLAHVLAAIADRAGLKDKSLVEDIAVGNHVPPGCGHIVSRMGALAAGYPNTTALYTVNRQCMASLQAVMTIANSITAGEIEIGIAAGAESLSTGRGLLGSFADQLSDKIRQNPESADCLFTPGQTSDNTSTDFGVTREEIDAFAAKAAQKASAAQKAGHFKDEIVPITVTWIDPESEEKKEILVSEDDVIRHNVTPETLSTLKPVFNADGVTTAGNSSPLADGAAALLMARRSVAEKHGLPILGKFVAAAAVGTKPRVMPIGPTVAIPKALAKAGITLNDVDIFELAEGFASGNVYTQKNLKIPEDKINPNGGAIPIGHPLGASPARQICTALAESKRRGAKVFVTAGCVLTGGGLAAVFVNEQ